MATARKAKPATATETKKAAPRRKPAAATKTTAAPKARKASAAATAKPAPAPDAPTDKEIELLAYRLWEERGRPEGSGEEDWARAVELLKA